ncbi:FadR/GntR family transcriptional regulator [Brassicibacter mesophilus]|uniref:FadR/GntR family transcriptional regulator n=1 Tax=Brassicibacter mesophilus TaxID=745119 RepID=UPI003D1A9B88
MFTQIKNKKIYEQVIEQIQEMIMNGTLKKEDKLPSERDLAEMLGVSRTSIREAFRSLEIIGLIESRQGEGTYIKGDLESGIFEPLSVMFMLNKGKSRDVLELRKVIEIEAARLAATRIESSQKDELIQIIEELKNADNEKDSAEIDKKFHYKIAELTGNYLILTLLNAISSLMEAFIKDARLKIMSEAKNRDTLIIHHKEICDAIISNNSDKAALAMKAHLDYINKIIKSL